MFCIHHANMLAKRRKIKKCFTGKKDVIIFVTVWNILTPFLTQPIRVIAGVNPTKYSKDIYAPKN